MALSKPSKTHRSYYVSFKDPNGERQRLKAFEDLEISKILDAQIQRLLNHHTCGTGIPADLQDWARHHLDTKRRDKLIECGLLPKAYGQGDSQLSDLLDRWSKDLEAKKRAPAHVRDTVHRIERLIAEGGFKRIRDINREQVNALFAKWQLPKKVKLTIGKELGLEKDEIQWQEKKGLSANTINHYIRSLSAFFSFLIEIEVTDRNPFMGMKKRQVTQDRRHVRRALDQDDVKKLISSTRKRLPVRAQATGPERALIYELAASTGFRAGEILALRPQDFDLSGPHPSVTLSGESTKNGQEAVLPLNRDLADQLIKHIEEHRDRRRPRSKKPMLFALANSANTRVEVLHEDLEAAGIEPKDERGRVVDFHSLRATFITRLARAGVDPATAQRLARHSDVRLTLQVYTEVGDREKREAVQMLEFGT